MALLVPAVEVAHDGDRRGGRCPDGERRSVDAVDDAGMSAELVLKLEVAALSEEVEIRRRQERRGSGPAAAFPTGTQAFFPGSRTKTRPITPAPRDSQRAVSQPSFCERSELENVDLIAPWTLS
jgi:hypothetical protein